MRYQSRYHRCMAMTLRLTDEETDALRRRAEAEQRSMQEVARAAVREYVERHEHDETVDRAAAWVVENFRDTLDRLGRA
jgi:predicted transcriptional regulator